MKNIVLFTGAGISAESGIKTFRDADGLWEGHDVMQVASSQGFAANPELVLDFYNQRRKQLLTVKPNKAHLAITKLQEHFNVTVITQNVDDLHERAGNKKVVHLHGELLKVRCTKNENEILEWKKDLVLGNLSSNNKQLRPHIVWFGEEVPLLQKAAKITETADVLIIIGTSMQVYPAASLVHYVNHGTPIYFIDPNPSIKQTDFNNLTIINKTAVNGLPTLVSTLIDTEL